MCVNLQYRGCRVAHQQDRATRDPEFWTTLHRRKRAPQTDPESHAESNQPFLRPSPCLRASNLLPGTLSPKHEVPKSRNLNPKTDKHTLQTLKPQTELNPNSRSTQDKTYNPYKTLDPVYSKP